MEGSLVWLTLARAEGVGRTRLAKLMEACPDPSDAWRLPVADLMQVDGWNRQAAESLAAIRSNREARQAATQIIEAVLRNGLRLICLPDPDYPVRLRYTPEPPPILYQAGPWRPDARPVVAIVGTRRPTAYGLATADRFARELAQAGAVVVSGMARGIDCAAHRGALQANGTTVAVLGGGADICYPREAARIYQAIRETGAVISEYPPGTPPISHHFPERNRIISGLSQAIVVVEAGEQSGTLITVSAALRQGRDVFAVPGPVTSPMSAGPHQLIRDGACLVSSAKEVLQEIGLPTQVEQVGEKMPQGLTPVQQRLLGWMGSAPRWAGDLAEACGLPAAEVQATLALLQLAGFVRQLPDGQFMRVG